MRNKGEKMVLANCRRLMSLPPWQKGEEFDLILHFDTQNVDDEKQGGKEAFGKIVEDGDNTAPCNDTRDESNGSLAVSSF
ncbi:hypothetical protein C4D60_Mb08t31780 [Musa balbisiana]|uniref:Uncharacterized protein n=1 Tax=Musa balbisiana TaxID=52838 RepID=A0A4S8K7X7_MUSBA|nr:hypothetical protein C4D60_Mb08t31780 [Musa balbisiana]